MYYSTLEQVAQYIEERTELDFKVAVDAFWCYAARPSRSITPPQDELLVCMYCVGWSWISGGGQAQAIVMVLLPGSRKPTST